MTDKKAEDTQSVESNTFTVNGKTFDVSTETGRAQLKGYLEATSELASKKANENHELKKQLEPFQKIAKTPARDLSSLQKEIARLEEEGDIESAYKLNKELTFQIAQEREKEKQFQSERSFVEKYVSSRPELGLSADMIHSFAFSNYADEIYNSEDGFGVLDRILQAHVKTSAPKTQEDEAPIQTLDTASTAPAVKQDKSDKSEEDDTSVFDLLVSE